MQALKLLLGSTPVVAPNLREWWAATLATRAQWKHSIDRAILLGAQADRLGYAFLGGYASAITVLDPTLGDSELGALCATESGGGHPRAILTSLAGGVLTGAKRFVSGGSLATVLLVVAKTGEHEGRPVLSVARIAARSPGVVLEDGPALDFVPEVPHGTVRFEGARVETVLEGDGYERYLKPFRTIEDLHVFGAVVGCLISNGRERWSQGTVEQLLAVLAAISHLGRQDPRSVDVHLALAGVLTIARGLIDGLDLAVLEPGFRERFERDRMVLQIAEKAREQRRVRAWDLPRPATAGRGPG